MAYPVGGMPPMGTSVNEQQYYYDDSNAWTKDFLVTRDPVFVNKSVIRGEYIGRKPYNYIYLAIFVSVINPVLGPVALLFSILSNRAYSNADLKASQKWANYAFMMGMLTFGITIILAIAIGFTVGRMNIKGGHTP